MGTVELENRGTEMDFVYQGEPKGLAIQPAPPKNFWMVDLSCIQVITF